MLWGAWWKSNRKIKQFGECVCVWCVDMFPLNDTCTNLWGTLEYSVNCKDKACGWLLIFKSGIHSGGADNQLFPKNLQKMVCIKHSISIISPIKNQQVCALWSTQVPNHSTSYASLCYHLSAFKESMHFIKMIIWFLAQPNGS